MSCFEIMQFDANFKNHFQAFTENGLIFHINYETKKFGFEKTLNYFRMNPDTELVYYYNSEELRKHYGQFPPPNAHRTHLDNAEWDGIKVITEAGLELFQYSK